jgi:NodT family efflux transporter outer membrane factor (OMF) lipoprotein
VVPTVRRVGFAALVSAALSFWGCTPFTEYVHNGFKVGPNYHRPPAPVARDWIDAQDRRLRRGPGDLSRWWKVFHDPVLDRLICSASQQNLTLRQAGFRVLQARAQLAIAVGTILPQTQTMTGSYERQAVSEETANRGSGSAKRFFSQWNYGFHLAWELDFWGRFRRAIESAHDTLDASVEGYDAVLVTLLGDVATAYVQMRTLEKRIAYAHKNVAIQRVTYDIARSKKDVFATGLDVDQALSTLKQTEAAIPELEIALRQTTNQLCILLGIPPEELRARLGPGDIPTAPPEVVVGIPADLLRRRPDVRQAERLAAAQSAQIGVAESAFYPHVTIMGTIEYQAELFKNLFNSRAMSGNITPGFQWDILNYGRILNNVRLQDARFQELVAAYQQTVLNANQETENGLVTFLKAHQRTRLQKESADAGAEAVKAILDLWRDGLLTDYTRVAQLELNLVVLEDTLAQAEGEIALGLIQVYRALGGGWQIRCTGCPETPIGPEWASPGPPPPALRANRSGVETAPRPKGAPPGPSRRASGSPLAIGSPRMPDRAPGGQSQQTDRQHRSSDEATIRPQGGPPADENVEVLRTEAVPAESSPGKGGQK